MTNAELAILSLVAEQPRHGYELEHIIVERGMRDWTEMGFSSIYYVLKKLEAAALIASQLEAAAQGPARRVYHVTSAGEAALREGVLAALRTPQAGRAPLLLGVGNLSAVSQAEALAALRQYCAVLDERLAHVQARWEAQKPLPYFVEALFTYSVTLIQAERDWVADFINQVEVHGGQD